MSLSTELQDSLLKRGWSAFRSPDVPLDQVARAWGTPRPSRVGHALVDALVPLTADEAPARSLSAFAGLSRQPLHTDGAHFVEPPRFVLLRHRAGEPGSTLILDFNDIGLSAEQLFRLKRAVWVINGGRGRLLASAIEEHAGGHRIRYDLQVMKPAHPNFEPMAAEFAAALASARLDTHHWGPGECVILDNWRVLHARDAVTASGGRVMERCQVW